MIQDTTSLNKLMECAKELINFSNGEVVFRTMVTKGGDQTRIEIFYGKKYVYFVKRNVDFLDDDNII